MNPQQIVQKLWNYCNVLRDDGLSYGDYVALCGGTDDDGIFVKTGGCRWCRCISWRRRGETWASAGDRPQATFFAPVSPRDPETRRIAIFRVSEETRRSSTGVNVTILRIQAHM